MAAADALSANPTDEEAGAAFLASAGAVVLGLLLLTGVGRR